jgi:hypothetical protein
VLIDEWQSTKHFTAIVGTCFSTFFRSLQSYVPWLHVSAKCISPTVW